jgi:signal transduction histidine kinase
MDLTRTPTPKATGPESTSASQTPLRGRWLLLARIIWFFVVGLVLGIVIASIPTYFAYLHVLTTSVAPRGTQLTQGGVRELHALGLSIDFYAVFTIVINALFVFSFWLVGAVLFWRKADAPLALFASFALVAFPIGFIPFQATTLPSAWWLPVQLVSFLDGTSLSIFLYLFPSGRFVPHWSRWLIIGWVIYEGFERFFPSSFVRIPAHNVLFFALLGSIVAVQIYRYRRVSTPLERQQTKWVVFGSTVGILGLIAAVSVSSLFPVFFQPGTLAYFVFYSILLLSPLCIPISIGIAILRSRLWDIDLIINRTLVYGALTLSVIGLYVLVVVGLGTLIQLQGNVLLSLLATGVIAVLFQPLRLRLQRGVNRMMYGERDDPYAVLASLGSRLEATLVTEKILPTIVETVAQALKLPYVAITMLPEQQPFIGTAAGITGAVDGAGAEVPDIVVSYGSPTTDPVQMPLVYQAETVGYLLLAARAGDTFGKADSRLLADLARQAGVAVYAVRLTTHLQHLTVSLQQAREHLVTTREEERRRLRRDLHDGLGPALASLTFKVDAARNLLKTDNERTESLLASVRQQAQEAITDIRRLVYNLRPPALDELGLLSALREQAAHYQHQGLEVEFDVPSTLPPLPAAVEVAAYRIAQEALTNVERHAQAQYCLLRLALDADVLQLDISDDGQGIPASHRIGVGLHTMHERASELGGSCTIKAGSSGGTTIQIRLPLTAARDAVLSSPQDTVHPQQESIAISDMSLVRQEE